MQFLSLSAKTTAACLPAGRHNLLSTARPIHPDPAKTSKTFIFANPPYVAIKNKNLVQKSVLEYEPHAALFGGQDGLFYIRKFLRGAKKYLADRGRIFMEFSPEQKGEIEKILKKYNYKNFSFHKDQYGKWRWAMVG